MKKTIFHNIRHARIFRVTYFFPPNSKQFPHFFKRAPYFFNLNTKKNYSRIPAILNRARLSPRSRSLGCDVTLYVIQLCRADSGWSKCTEQSPRHEPLTVLNFCPWTRGIQSVMVKHWSTIGSFQKVIRATASKYRESVDSKENSDFLLLRQKDPFGELFSEIYFQSSSEFTVL